MNNYLRLTRLLLKTASGMSLAGLQIKRRSSDNQKSTKILTAVLVLCFLPLLFAFYKLLDVLYPSFASIGQEGTLLMLVLLFNSAFAVLTAIFMVPSVFYFAKDIEHLLPLPIQPHIIIASKFTIALIFEYLIGLIFFIPLIAVFVMHGYTDPLFLLSFIPAFILVPVVPVVYAGIIVVVIMSFSGFGFMKNKDFFNYASGILAIVLALGMNVVITQNSDMPTETLMALLTEGNNSLIQILQSVYFYLPFLIKAMFNGSILDLLLFIGIPLLFFAIFLEIAKHLYIRGVHGIAETSVSNKKLSNAAVEKLSVKRNTMYTYAVKELRILFRTPVYFMNCILSSLLIPVIMMIPFMASGSTDELGALMLLKDNIQFSNSQHAALFLAGCAAAAIVANTVNCIAASAISREGSNFFVMKFIPLSYATQVNAKVLASLIISFFTFACMFIAAVLFLAPPTLLAVTGFVFGIVAMIGAAYISIVVDLFNPKLDWVSEQEAVKQNFMLFIPMLGGFAYGFILVLAAFVMHPALLFVIIAALSVFFVKLTLHLAEKTLSQL